MIIRWMKLKDASWNPYLIFVKQKSHSTFYPTDEQTP